MTPFGSKYYSIAVAIAMAQPSLQLASTYGSTGNCIVEPQPGYNITALQICTNTFPPSTEGDSDVKIPGSLSLAFLTAGSDPLAAGQSNLGNAWVNYLQYAVYDKNQDPTQFFPLGYDVGTCAAFACQNGQPCAPWGNGGSPVDKYESGDGSQWWTSGIGVTPQTSYGGYQLLDFVDTDPPFFNLRNTAETWFNCTPATRDPCTDGNGTTVRYLYDCKPNFPAQLIPPPYNSGGINNHGDFDCSAGGNDGAIGLLAQAVDEKIDDSVTALPGEPMYCNYDAAQDSGNICVYYQGTATGNGTLTRSLLDQLHRRYGGNNCGNIPVEYPGVDWLAFGYLTVSGNTPHCEPCTPLGISGSSACACPGFPA